MENPVILVAEDVPLNMTLIVTVLQKMFPQAEIVEAFNGQQALEIAQRIRLSLILMDIQMPVMDGLEATRRIRQMESGYGIEQPVPIIALTAYTLNQQKEICVQAGMNDFLSKPIDLVSIRKVLSRYLTPQPPIDERMDASKATNANLHFNLEGLLERTFMEQPMLLDLANKAVSSLTDHLRSLLLALGENNTEQIKKTAHTIKGIGLNMSFDRLAQMARHIESLATENQEKLPEQFQLLEKEIASIQKIIHEIQSP